MKTSKQRSIETAEMIHTNIYWRTLERRHEVSMICQQLDDITRYLYALHNENCNCADCDCSIGHAINDLTQLRVNLILGALRKKEYDI